MMSRKLTLVCSLFIVVTIFGCTKSGSDVSAINLNEGSWEITTVMSMPGMSAQTVKNTQCIKKDNLIPKQEEQGKDCEVVEKKIRGNTVDWKYSCQTPGGKMISDGSVTYAGETMKGLLSMNAGGRKWEVKISGKRIGDCK